MNFLKTKCAEETSSRHVCQPRRKSNKTKKIASAISPFIFQVQVSQMISKSQIQFLLSTLLIYLHYCQRIALLGQTFICTKNLWDLRRLKPCTFLFYWAVNVLIQFIFGAAMFPYSGPDTHIKFQIFHFDKPPVFERYLLLDSVFNTEQMQGLWWSGVNQMCRTTIWRRGYKQDS